MEEFLKSDKDLTPQQVKAFLTICFEEIKKLNKKIDTLQNNVENLEQVNGIGEDYDDYDDY